MFSVSFRLTPMQKLGPKLDLKLAMLHNCWINSGKYNGDAWFAMFPLKSREKFRGSWTLENNSDWTTKR